MKKKLLAILIMALVCVAAFAQEDTIFDSGIKKWVEKVKEKTAGGGQKTVVLIYAESSQRELITDKITAYFIDDSNYILIDEEEHGIEMTERLTNEKAVEIAKKLGAQLVLHGVVGIDEWGWHYIRMVSTEIAASGAVKNDNWNYYVETKSSKRSASKSSDWDEDAPKYMLQVSYTGAASQYEPPTGGVMGFDATSQHAISLSMSMDLFKGLMNIGIDFGIKDVSFGGNNLKFKDVMSIGGMIGFKWVTMSIDYRIYNGFATFPFGNEDKIALIPLDQPHYGFGRQFSCVDERTVAMMLIRDGYVFNAGIIWNNMKGAAAIQDKYFDPNVEVNTYGLRLRLRLGDILDLVYRFFDLEDMSDPVNKWGFVCDIQQDLAWGSAKLSGNVAEAIKKDKNMGKLDLDAFYASVMFKLGVKLTRYYSSNKYWNIFAAGLDVQGGGNEIGSLSPLGTAVIGAFVSTGFAF